MPVLACVPPWVGELWEIGEEGANGEGLLQLPVPCWDVVVIGACTAGTGQLHPPTRAQTRMLYT